MSVPGSQSTFYNPGQYAAYDQNWYNTPSGRQIREQNLPQAWYSYGRQQGIPDSGTDPFGRWFSQQYPQYNSGYAAATMENPYINIDEYTPTLGGYDDWKRRFQNVAPQVRGEQPADYGSTTKWLGW